MLIKSWGDSLGFLCARFPLVTIEIVTFALGNESKLKYVILYLEEKVQMRCSYVQVIC